MTELKDQHGGMWSSYSNPLHLSSGRISRPIESEISPSSTASPHPGRPRSDSEHHPYTAYRYSQEAADLYDKNPNASLASPQSYPNLKRPYPQGDQPPYTEIIQDLRDDGSKLNVNSGHKLLSFRKVQGKQTIVDQHGRVQQLELSAQLHGMFFLSEMPTGANDGTVAQPELTCYRRNLFQVSGSLITPRGQLSVVTEAGETLPVESTEVTISAIESVDNHPVRLIVIPWKTPPPNSPETNQAPDQEPPNLPLIPFQDDGQQAEGEYAVYPIGWRRLQFRIATANNGRRKELQQHFVLHLKVVGTLTNGSRIALAESKTAPIVVRGRSPRNFQTRKEIPLLGSSAGSRGQALVETGLGIVAGPLNVKPQDANKIRPISMAVPRSDFTFTAPGPKMPTSPVSVRSNSYSTSWSPPVSQMPATSSGAYPIPSISSDPYQKLPLSAGGGYATEGQDIALPQTSMPSMPLSLVGHEQQQQQQAQQQRSQYTYMMGSSAPSQLPIGAAADTTLNVPRYVDSNPRPMKSPRHSSHQSIPGMSSLNTGNDGPGGYRYGPPYGGTAPAPAASHQEPQHSPPNPAGSGGGAGGPSSVHAHQQQARDYLPSSQHPWGTAVAGDPTSGGVGYANGEARPYGSSFQDPYKAAGEPKADGPHPAQQGAQGYPSHRSSFDVINNYSWGA